MSPLDSLPVNFKVSSTPSHTSCVWCQQNWTRALCHNLSVGESWVLFYNYKLYSISVLQIIFHICNNCLIFSTFTEQMNNYSCTYIGLFEDFYWSTKDTITFTVFFWYLYGCCFVVQIRFLHGYERF